MATVVNDPTVPSTTQPSPEPQSDPIKNPAATPTSSPDGVQYQAATYTGTGDNVKVKGTAGADRISTKDLLADSDHVITTGAGNDVFIFRQDDATNPALRNALVDLGAGDNDQIVLANMMSDYQITFRNNGSIKFEYIGDDTTDNAAITFTGAEMVTFRNIDHNAGSPDVYYKAESYTIAELAAIYGVPVLA
ncbi:hypothetical protein CLBKND_01017 [Methylorubrum aminovorans]